MNDITKIKKTIYSLLEVDTEYIKEHPFNEEANYANYIIIYIIWRHFSYTLAKIGFLVNRDHTSVYHGLKLINLSMQGYNNKLKDKLIKVLNYYNLIFIQYEYKRRRKIYQSID